MCFLWPQQEHRRQRRWVEDFADQCLLWRLLSYKTFFAPELSLPTNLGVGLYWLFPASTIKFLSRRSLKSQWVYLAPHEDNNIQLLSTVRSRKWKNNFVVTGHRPATSWVHYTRSCNTQSSAPEDGQNNCLKHVELTGIINKPLLLHLVGCLYYLYQ